MAELVWGERQRKGFPQLQKKGVGSIIGLTIFTNSNDYMKCSNAGWELGPG